MKDKVFFPIVFLLALGIIFLGVGFGKKPMPKPIDAKSIGSSLVFVPEDLNFAYRNDGFAFTRADKVPGNAPGPHMISLNKFEDKLAIVYVLGDKTAAQIKGRTISVIILAHPMAHQEPKEIAIGLKVGENIVWKNAPMPNKLVPIIVNFDPQIGKVDAIVINPATEGQEHGIELQAMALKLS